MRKDNYLALRSRAIKVLHTTLENSPQAAEIPRRLYIADPRMVLTPISPFVTKAPVRKMTLWYISVWLFLQGKEL